MYILEWPFISIYLKLLVFSLIFNFFLVTVHCNKSNLYLAFFTDPRLVILACIYFIHIILLTSKRSSPLVLRNKQYLQFVTTAIHPTVQQITTTS